MYPKKVIEAQNKSKDRTRIVLVVSAAVCVVFIVSIGSFFLIIDLQNPAKVADTVDTRAKEASNTTGTADMIADKINGVAAEDSSSLKLKAQFMVTNYRAKPGQEITFDASQSIVEGASITKYEWDLDGDGKFETSTTSPTINHTYNKEFNSTVKVRVSADDGEVSSATASVLISSNLVDTRPAPAKNLKATIKSTVNNVSTATISWDTASGVDYWNAVLNEEAPIGYLTGDRSSFDLSDIDRTKDTTITITAIRKNVGSSEGASITIKAIGH